MFFRRCLGLLALLSSGACSQTSNFSRHLFFHVAFPSSLKQPVSGRLLIFLSKGTGAQDLDQSEFAPASGAVCAKEVRAVKGGSSIDVDADEISFPVPFSALANGDYQAQALLDVDHTYAYRGRSAGDLLSDVVPLPHFSPGSAQPPTLRLLRTVPASAPEPLGPLVHIENFASPKLTEFFHRPIAMRALVVLPPGYAKSQSRYPTAYYTHGFGAAFDDLRDRANAFAAAMANKKMPEMVWVLLDESLPTGTHEFADSANNGPWGAALTTEFIPYLESRYRLDARSEARFLNGHSSGGWATLWLQVTYPRVFGGTWSTSPDPSDFHDFTGVDLYASHANMYHRINGSPYPLERANGKVVSTLERDARLESVLGAYGGQFSSFEWVFSPRGEDGRPLLLFNRTTGEIDSGVVQAWMRYDIAQIIRTQWPHLAPVLNGKIHVFVGTADTFYLDGPAHKLDATLKQVGAKAEVTFIEGRTHMDLYRIGADPGGLYSRIAAEMYRTWVLSKASDSTRDASHSPIRNERLRPAS